MSAGSEELGVDTIEIKAMMSRVVHYEGNERQGATRKMQDARSTRGAAT